MGCPATPGVVALLDVDLDAVLLLGRPWYGLWPLEQACRVGRPVYLGTSLTADDSKADDVVRQVRVANLPVMAELAPRLAPVTNRLRALLPKLGTLRSVICTVARCGRGAESAQAAGLAMIDWCTAFLGAPLAEIQGFDDSSGHAAWLLHFAGAVTLISTWPSRCAIHASATGRNEGFGRGNVPAASPLADRTTAARDRSAGQASAYTNGSGAIPRGPVGRTAAGAEFGRCLSDAHPIAGGPAG